MGQSTIKLDDVELFVEVVRAKSFSGAARRLSLPKSTVSRRVAELEEALGTRLLERTTRHLSLTELGRSYYERAAQHIDDLNDAGKALLEQDDEPRGTLRVTAPADTNMAEAIVRYQLAYPKVRVVLYGTSHRVDLVAESFDVAIRAGELPDSTLIARPVGLSRRWLVASNAYLKGAPALVQPNDLTNHACLVHGIRGPSEVWEFEVGTGLEKVEVSGPLATNSMETLMMAVVHGQGVGYLPEAACFQALEAGKVVRLLPQFRSPPVPVNIVFPSSRMMTPKLRSFIDFMEVELKRWLHCKAFSSEACSK